MELPKVKKHGDGFVELTCKDDDVKLAEEKKLPWLDDDVDVPVKTKAEEKLQVVEAEKRAAELREPKPAEKESLVEERPESMSELSVADVAQGAPPWVARSPEGRKPTVLQVVSKPFVRGVKENRSLIEERIDAASRDVLPVENPPAGRDLSHAEAVEKAREIWRQKQEDDKRKGLFGRLGGLLGFK